MATPFFLIDFENVQPKALDRLKPGAARIKVFLGEQQSKLMLDVVQALQPFGSDAQYIQIHGSGPDAVDFHIAYYIGRIAAEEPGVAFNIISKDKGFDPLVRHLEKQGIACRRLTEIPGGPATAGAAKKATKAVAKKVAKKAATKVTVTVLPEANGAAPAAKGATTSARVPEVIALLRKSTKPTKLSGLKASIKSWFKPALDDKAVDAIVQSLQSSKKITVSGTKVVYSLG
ncbi:PIN domain-containing protein [Lysobacter fragariae]